MHCLLKTELIDTHCLVDFLTWHTNPVINLDGYIWAFSSLATEHIQICCLEGTHLETCTSINSYPLW